MSPAQPREKGYQPPHKPLELATDTEITTPGKVTSKIAGGPYKQRSVAQREMDLIVTARKYLMGSSISQISEDLTNMRPYYVSYEMVRFDIQLLIQRWQESYLLDFSAAKAKELARIDQLEAAYWEGWERSKIDKEITETEKVQDSSTSRKNVTVPTYTRSKAKKRTETTPGESQFLNGIQWCIDKRCQILGLNAPKQFEVSWREEAKKAGIDPDRLYNDLVTKYITEAERKDLQAERDTIMMNGA